MPGLGDSLRQFKSAFKSGPTDPGAWAELESFGRFAGTGEVTADLELPEGRVAISAEDYEAVEELEVELGGPAGEPLTLRRHYSEQYDDQEALRSLDRVASARISQPGLHRLRVKAPHPDRPLLILVGEEMTAGDAVADMIPGAKLWKKLRGK